MTDLVPLYFDHANVRMIMHDGEPWWVLADAAPFLDLSNPSKLANRLEGYQKAVIPIRDISSGQFRQMIVVNEAGIYALTLNSRKPEARAFARWLFTEVLPSIRKYGFYDPDRLAKMQAAAVPPSVPTTQYERLLEELARFEQENGFSAFEIPGLSKQKIKAASLGAGLQRMFGRNDLWFYLMSSGVDLFYVLHGRRQDQPHGSRKLIA